MSDDAARYAIYYTPPADHPLTRIAVRWLGRDAFDGRAAPMIAGLGNRDREVTADPRRYGFHATLKAPFRLAAGYDVEDLEEALRAFSSTCQPCPIGPLRVDLLESFFALVPIQPAPALRAFAACVVESFDHFRAPLNASEIKRRLRIPLDKIETINVTRWGYPYVFNRFRFHMTLTGWVPAAEIPGLRRQLEETFQPLLGEDYSIGALTLFTQKGADAEFVVRSEFALGGATRALGHPA